MRKLGGGLSRNTSIELISACLLILQDFADFVVREKFHVDDWDKPGFPTRWQASNYPLFQPVDIRAVGLRDLQDYGSWLFKGRTTGTYRVVFDNSLIARKSRSALRNPRSVKVRFFIHEIGHLVLHDRHLLGGVNPEQAANSSLPKMEAEAWFFQSVILGLIRGDRAYSAKIVPDGVDDSIWSI